MSQSIIQVDSFARKPFAGNPAGVCIMSKAAEENWMQAVAMEMNLSETAFLYPADGGYNLRWFTPRAEVQLCGHATLASAFVLYTDGHISKDQPVSFFTKSGELKAGWADGKIRMDFPAIKTKKCSAPTGLIEALGIEPEYIARADDDYLLVVKTESDVRRIAPNFSDLKGITARGICVTAPADTTYDFVSRFFAPAVGIDEDPVTGSAHCALAPYWAKRLGQKQLSAFQASERGGEVGLEIQGDRVIILGSAVLTIRGELFAE